MVGLIYINEVSHIHIIIQYVHLFADDSSSLPVRMYFCLVRNRRNVVGWNFNIYTVINVNSSLPDTSREIWGNVFQPDVIFQNLNLYHNLCDAIYVSRTGAGNMSRRSATMTSRPLYSDLYMHIY